MSSVGAQGVWCSDCRTDDCDGQHGVDGIPAVAYRTTSEWHNRRIARGGEQRFACCHGETGRF
jgi:hypothetical protein